MQQIRLPTDGTCGRIADKEDHEELQGGIEQGQRTIHHAQTCQQDEQRQNGDHATSQHLGPPPAQPSGQFQPLHRATQSQQAQRIGLPVLSKGLKRVQKGQLLAAKSYLFRLITDSFKVQIAGQQALSSRGHTAVHASIQRPGAEYVEVKAERMVIVDKLLPVVKGAITASQCLQFMLIDLLQIFAVGYPGSIAAVEQPRQHITCQRQANQQQATPAQQCAGIEGQSGYEQSEKKYFGQNESPIAPLQSGHNARQRFITSRIRSEEHTSELQSRQYLVCRLLLEK